MIFSLFASAALAGTNRTQTEQEYWAMWQDFQEIRWLGDFVTFEDHASRFSIFKDNVDRINTHNKEGHSWLMGVTPFADMTPQEFKARVIGDTCKPHFAKNAKLNAARTKLDKGRRRAEKVASSVDWDAEGNVSPVKNQGQCGSCWSFSTTGAIEARTSIKNGVSPISLSEQELVDCDDNDNGCEGGAMQNGFLYAEEHNGLCLESAYPYTASDGTCHSSSCTHYSPVSSYTTVYSGETYLKSAVAAGPVSVAIEADQMAFQLYSSGVFDGTCGTSLDHGVLAVGYDDTASSPYWKIKNSWGSSWGENGYIRLCKDCGKNGSSGQCGLAMDASYPIIA